LTACKSNLKNLATSLEMYASDNAGRYPTALPRLLPRHLKVLPTCPSAQKDTYSESYTMVATPDNFSLCCRGHHHKKTRVKPDNPVYNGDLGLLEEREPY
jgi:hypothetical protein